MKPLPRHCLLALIAAAALAACGGGGGGSAPTVDFPTTRAGAASAGADMTTANFPTLSTRAVDSLLATVGGDLVLSQPLSAGRANVASLGRWAARRSAASIGSAARKQGLAVDSETFSCGVSGTLTVTVNDADNNNVLTAGDSASFDFIDCVETGAPAINGGFALVFNVLVLNSQQEPTAFDASVTMNALTVEGLGSLDGDARLWVAPVTGGERSFVRYQRMASVTAGVTSVLDFDVDGTTTATTSTSRINGNLQLGAQVYAVTQVAAFDTSAGDPSSGQLRITDSEGDRLLLTADGTLVDREFFLAGNTSSTPDAALIGTPWSAFRQ
ncbi:hypothetical protein [Variovorax sp. YR752]|uniref:hypothetical protein n=1 Tax=Variovorax sp. YR752 TaxID=1884383 RepID=UPI003137A074